MFWNNKKSSRETNFANKNNNQYVIDASNAILRIGNANNTSELQNAKRKLNNIISAALSARIPTNQLTTILQDLSNQIYLCRWNDEQHGNQDSLLQQRLSILQEVFNRLDSSY